MRCWAHARESGASYRHNAGPIRAIRSHLPDAVLGPYGRIGAPPVGISGPIRMHRLCLAGTLLAPYERIGGTSQMRCWAHARESGASRRHNAGPIRAIRSHLPDVVLGAFEIIGAPPVCISGPIQAHRQCLAGTFLAPYERIGGTSQMCCWAHARESGASYRHNAGPIRAIRSHLPDAVLGPYERIGAPPVCISGPIQAHRQCLAGTFLAPYERIGGTSQMRCWAHARESGASRWHNAGPIRAIRSHLPDAVLGPYERIGAPPVCISGPIQAHRQCLAGTLLAPYERNGGTSQMRCWAHARDPGGSHRN